MCLPTLAKDYLKKLWACEVAKSMEIDGILLQKHDMQHETCLIQFFLAIIGMGFSVLLASGE